MGRCPLQRGVPGLSLSSNRDHIKAVRHLKQGAFAALVDVNRRTGQKTDKAGDVVMDSKRVTLTCLLRGAFAELSETAQSVYIYRIAA